MNRVHVVLAYIFILSIKTSSEAYVSGHSKFFRDSTQTTIDLLYDVHVRNDSIPRTKTGEVDIADKNLLNYVRPTERRVMSILDRFSSAISESFDVIWEKGAQQMPSSSQFIAFAPLILEKKAGLNVVRGDHWRDSFESLFPSSYVPSSFVVYQQYYYVSLKNSVGSTFENPFPLPQNRITSIRLNSGSQAGTNFLNQHAQLTQDIKNYYKLWGEKKMSWIDHESHFRSNDLFHRIADVELLSHVLASGKKRIVVYAGGWHCENLKGLLPAYGFREVSSNFGGLTLFDELPVSLLDHVERDVNNNPLPAAKADVGALNAIGKTGGTVKPKPGKKVIPPLKKLGKKLGKKKLGALVSFSKKKSTKV